MIHRTGRPASNIVREGCFTPFSFKGAMAIIRTDDISDVAGAASCLEIANELDSKWEYVIFFSCFPYIIINKQRLHIQALLHETEGNAKCVGGKDDVSAHPIPY